MNCAKWEGWAALSAGDDLAEAEVRSLTKHVAGCAACREFAAGLALSQAALRELRDEVPDATEYVRLREAVMRRVSASRAAGWRPYAIAAGLLVMISAGYWEVRQDRSLMIAVQKPDRVDAPVAPSLPVSERRPLGSGRRRHHKPNPEPPLVVKFVTDDPEVTIIWLVDQKGEGE